jgi:hypothetical protein
VRPVPFGQGRQSPAAEKRAQQQAEKQKQLESKYEWREAVEKFVRLWADRCDSAAQAPADAAGAGESGGFSGSKIGEADDKSKDAKAAARQADADSSKKAAAPEPKPAVAMPFPLHGGAAISKEFHIQWPPDLPSELRASVPDPLAVHYVRLEGQGEAGRILTHYRNALKTRAAVREIDNGKWLDAVQKDSASHRTRSVDVLVTHQSPAAEADKKGRLENLTVEVLVVEIASLDPEPAPKTAKSSREERPSISSRTSR